MAIAYRIVPWAPRTECIAKLVLERLIESVCVVADEVPIDRKATIRQQVNELASLLKQIDESELAMTFTRVGLLLGKNIRMMARATVAASISGSSERCLRTARTLGNPLPSSPSTKPGRTSEPSPR